MLAQKLILGPQQKQMQNPSVEISVAHNPGYTRLPAKDALTVNI